MLALKILADRYFSEGYSSLQTEGIVRFNILCKIVLYLPYDCFINYKIKKITAV